MASILKPRNATGICKKAVQPPLLHANAPITSKYMEKTANITIGAEKIKKPVLFTPRSINRQIPTDAIMARSSHKTGAPSPITDKIIARKK